MNNYEKEWFVEVPWGKIGVIAWGDSNLEPVLMVHGRQDSAATFRLLVQHLPKKFYYVALDLPGNGKSDHLPKGLPITTFDFVSVIRIFVNHFGWEKFIYVAHSLGTVIGKYFMLAYPGRVTKVVDLDPVPAYETYEIHEYPKWFETFYTTFYDQDQYKKFNVTSETAPRITYKQAFDAMQNARGLTDEATVQAVDRNLEGLGGGYYRFIFDQRMKNVIRPALPSKFVKILYESLKTPTLTVLPSMIVRLGVYNSTPYVLEERDNHYVRILESTHDLHLNEPEIVGDMITDFLLSDYSIKSKL